MNILASFNMLSRFVGIALLAGGITACGGGGGDDPGDASPGRDSAGSETRNSPITRTNYVEVATLGFSLAGFDEIATSNSGLDGNPSQSSNPEPSLSAASTTSAMCDSGSGRITSNIAINGQITKGDRYSGTYNNCRTNLPDGGYLVMNGGFSLVYKEINGDYLLGNFGSIAAEMRYDSFSMTAYIPPQPEFFSAMNGDLSFKLEKTATTSRAEFTSHRFELSSREGNDPEVGFIMTNYDIEMVDNLANSVRKITGGYDVSVTSADFSGSFAINFDLRGMTTSEYLSGGTITISDKNSMAVVTITILSEYMIQVEFDENGDGIPEEFRTFNRQELEG